MYLYINRDKYIYVKLQVIRVTDIIYLHIAHIIMYNIIIYYNGINVGELQYRLINVRHI